MPAVIEWHRTGLVPLGRELTDDPRCRFVESDFFALAADSRTGFDPVHGKNLIPPDPAGV